MFFQAPEQDARSPRSEQPAAGGPGGMWISAQPILWILWEIPFNPERRGRRHRSEKAGRAGSGPESKERGDHSREPELLLRVFSLRTTIKVFSHFLRLNKPLNPKL